MTRAASDWREPVWRISTRPPRSSTTANLQGIDRFELSLALTTILVDLQAPLAGPGSEDHTGWRFAPLPFFGLAVRAHEHVVLGLGAYVLTGYGGA